MAMKSPIPAIQIDPRGHTFEQCVAEGGPALRCQVCDLIWWPDQRCPKQSCKQRQAANDRRR
jgi:hypothetical protein